jgi:hypothetical protein
LKAGFLTGVVPATDREKNNVDNIEINVYRILT